MLLRLLLICWDWDLFFDVFYHAYDMAILEMYANYLLQRFRENFSMHVFENYWRRDIYFLNICITRVFYRFNRSRALHE